MTRRKKTTTTVDFTGVKSGGRVPEGVYNVEVKEVSIESGPSGYDYLKWVFVISEGDYEGAKLYNNSSLNPDALWSLRHLLECLDIEVPDGEMDLDLSDYVGQECAVEVVHETYDGKKMSKIAEFAKPEESSAKKSKSSKEDDDNEEPDWSMDDEKEVFGMSSEELEEVIEDDDLNVDPSKKIYSGRTGLTKLRKKVWSLIVNKYNLEENEDEEEEKDNKDDDFDLDDASREELEEFIEEEGLSIKATSLKFKGSKGLKSLRTAVKEAMEEDDDSDKDDEPSDKEIKKAITEVKKLQRDRGGKLQGFVDEFELDIDLDDYDDTKERKEAIIEVLEEILED